MKEQTGFSITVQDGIATVTMKMPGKVNTLGETFIVGLESTLTEVFAVEGLRGLIIASGHNDFCAGANIDVLFHARDPAQIYEGTRVLNGLFRRLETGGVPVVAAITGTALGGGYELALACHHRIAINDARISIGLPEASIGVIPGAGGTQRLPYLVGIAKALEILAGGMQKRAPAALDAGMVDALATNREELLVMAKDWIDQNQGFIQPWDKAAPFPGGIQPGTREARNLFTGACAFSYKKTVGAYPAAQAIIEVVFEGLKLDFDRALEVEGRAFTRLAVSDQVKDMLRTLWYHRMAVEKQEGLPHCSDPEIRKVAILGA